MKKGFTIIELIFTITIIGILSTIAIPKLSAIKGDADGLSDMLEKRANNIDRVREENGMNRK